MVKTADSQMYNVKTTFKSIRTTAWINKNKVQSFSWQQNTTWVCFPIFKRQLRHGDNPNMGTKYSHISKTSTYPKHSQTINPTLTTGFHWTNSKLNHQWKNHFTSAWWRFSWLYKQHHKTLDENRKQRSRLVTTLLNGRIFKWHNKTQNNTCTNIWRFPEIGVPANHPF